MRLTQAESERNRKQILEVAGRLFRQRGFDGVGVDDLMKAAGFTHGGFYNHFASKAELEAEASAKGVAEAIAMLVESLSDPRKDGWERFVRGYLSAEERRVARARRAGAASPTPATVTRAECWSGPACAYALFSTCARLASVHPRERLWCGRSS